MKVIALMFVASIFGIGGISYANNASHAAKAARDSATVQQSEASGEKANAIALLAGRGNAIDAAVEAATSSR